MESASIMTEVVDEGDTVFIPFPDDMLQQLDLRVDEEVILRFVKGVPRIMVTRHPHDGRDEESEVTDVE